MHTPDAIEAWRREQEERARFALLMERLTRPRRPYALMPLPCTPGEWAVCALGVLLVVAAIYLAGYGAGAAEWRAMFGGQQ